MGVMMIKSVLTWPLSTALKATALKAVFAAPVLVGLVALVALGACASQGRVGANAPPADRTFSLPDTTSSVQGADFRIAPLDVIDIRVFGVERVSGSFQIDPDGNVELPLLGALDAKGYTSFEFARLLERKYGESYLQNPQVSVRITTSFGQQVTVDGAVEKPGVFPIRGATTLMQVLAVAGGASETADLRRVVIFRTIEGQRKAAAFDMTRIRAGAEPDPSVFGNDIIVVDGSDAAAGWREVIRSLPVLGLFLGVF
jgi:polysaccharide export outer membrane protein